MRKNVATQRRKPRVFIQRNCRFCDNKIDFIDYKDSENIKKFQTEKGKILPRRITGNCSKHQKIVAVAIKKARELSLVY